MPVTLAWPSAHFQGGEPMVSQRTHLLAQQVNLQRAQMGLPPRATALPKFTQRRLAQTELITHQNFSHAAIAARLECSAGTAA
jgi:hypothetical protein